MRYLIALLVTIAVIIFVIIKLLTGGGGEAQVTPPNLGSYAGTDTTVQFTIDNAVQSSDGHRDIVVTIGKDQATLTVTKGYEGEVVNSQTYDNNTTAYANFLLALDKTGGFTLGNDTKDLRDERGYCGNGNRYSYDIINASGSKTQHYWSTSCKEKTFRGDINATQQLFKAQIPDFNTLTQDVDY